MKLEMKLYELNKIRYFRTNGGANLHFEKIDKLESIISDKINKLTNIEKLFI